jgi:hypothetical protein
VKDALATGNSSGDMIREHAADAARDEVEIRKEQNVIVVVPVTADDPIPWLGKQPIALDVDDPSVNHDRYLYGR